MIAFANEKDPDDIDDFTFDWVNVLNVGETIATFVPLVVTAGITIATSSTTGTTTTCRLTGGIEATKHLIRYRITTNAGRQLDETASVKVKTR